jgi:hypothetical protein
MMMLNAPLTDIDLVELSDLTWGLVDPDGEHEAEEQAWTALLPVGWPPVATVEELCARLEEIVQALVPPAPAVPLRAVAAVMTFLAVHPERRGGDQAVLVDAMREAFPSGVLAPEVAAWLDERRQAPPARERAHGAPDPRRHFHSRPFRPGGGEAR